MIFLFRLLSRLPLGWVHALGGVLGRLTYWLSPTYRRHLKANLAQAGLGGDLALPVAAEAGKQALELSRIWLRTLEEANAQVTEVVGLTLVQEAMAAGKGVLYLTPHLGCFEITAQYLSSLGDITVLYRPPRQAALQELIETGRRRSNLHLAPADLSGVRALIKALRKGQSVGILPDQAPKTGEGVWLDFFGRPAYTMTLAARLSETGATVLMTWGERLPGGQGYRIHFSAPQRVLAGDTVARAAAINHEIEHLIRQCPAQYLWGYNRYKRPSGAEAPPTPQAGE
ncbi:MAG: lysophospholipid acyltransferase family protein [Azonexus sp.]|nr:lysophospholipid acyltransferase family protein [Betaproteobacteria bacterium]MBK8919496.1 lysophospholipid acyltransferase family protein [Betaproteobacteria bacterium]MBP6036264.1 lysophospholipid acyltransferase family protein [Azonexus sp.]MBP6906872.1 lysophospholipid acyltransferase family protein [Azonexus sp.]